MSLGMLLVGLWLLSLLLDCEPLFQAFGFSNPSHHAAVVLLAFVSGPLTFVFRPLLAWRSRSQEYAADRFAKKAIRGSNDLSNALLALSRDNLSNLTPHPLYSFFHYSHPTLAERLAAMESTSVS